MLFRSSVGRTIDVIGDGWSFMVLRECFFGTTRFDEFQRMLGLPRTTLNNRLKQLVALGVLTPRPYGTRPLRHEYKLTDAGRDLYPVMLALMTFGDRWLARRRGRSKPLQLVHSVCGRPCTAVVVWGFTDRYAWRAPLAPDILDAGYRPKPAFETLQRMLSGT